MVFQGRTDELKEFLNNQMQQYSMKLEYEKAARCRDQIKGLDSLTQEQKITIPDSFISKDIIAMASNTNNSCVQLFQMRAGKLVGRLGFNVETSSFSKNEILQRFIEDCLTSLYPKYF